MSENLTPSPFPKGKGKNKVSVIIPARKEAYLARTVAELLDNAAGDVEIIVVLDGPEQLEMPAKDKRIRYVRLSRVSGRRAAVNAGGAAAKGDFLMKIDAHCMIGEGWDEILKADCQDNQIVVPTRYWLDPERWEIRRDMPRVTAMYFTYPYLQPFRPVLTGRPWQSRAVETAGQEICEDLTFQGSLYFMRREHWERLGEQSESGYGTFAGEPEELGLKTQLGPWQGQVIRNRKTWYAHWGKPNIYWIEAQQRGHVTPEDLQAGFAFVVDYWFNNRWEERGHDFEWLVEKWWPLPEWPDDWRTYHKAALARYGG